MNLMEIIIEIYKWSKCKGKLTFKCLSPVNTFNNTIPTLKSQGTLQKGRGTVRARGPRQLLRDLPEGGRERGTKEGGRGEREDGALAELTWTLNSL